VPGIGIPELIIVLVILLVIFGPKRLPGLGRSLCSGMREFKESVTGPGKDDDDDRTALPSGAGPVSADPVAATPVREPEPQPAPSQVPTEPRA